MKFGTQCVTVKKGLAETALRLFIVVCLMSDCDPLILFYILKKMESLFFYSRVKKMCHMCHKSKKYCNTPHNGYFFYVGLGDTL